MTTSTRRLVLAVLLGTGVLAATLVRSLGYGIGKRPFDAVTWRAHPSHVREGDPTRQRMAPDLVRHARLRGLSRDSVLGLLGPADSTEYFKDWHLVYWLGPEHSLVVVDSEWLVIRFDADGRVGEAQLVTD